ncbi:single-strand DNA-binding protein [Pseudochelatococcus lubricantis]|uniref:Single-stranded DNA-binding protein n=1 Tax=Pseudochelatococcus lubricantis TaxID=1538102 RepID=A0ABX0UZB4_9HYPH|nr:single-stranded DNA-binding protein [Pseudochelatococcus lubricantis]NIJ57204.1 single-strand DNA-binding protein [Pseudochelatococcus lubricantis]
MSMNRVILVGRVGKDPEVRSFNNGGRVANFSLATSERWKDKATGERKEKTEWTNIVVTGDGLVGVVERFVRKGSQIGIEGKLQTRKYQDRDGNERSVTEVVVGGFGGNVTLLDSKRSDDDSSSSRPADTGRSYGAAKAGDSYGGGGAYSSDLDDDIPFACEWR